MLTWCLSVKAELVELQVFEPTRSEEGLVLSFSTRFELSRTVQDALKKGVPLFFEAEVTVFRERWYWRDKLVATAKRSWRLAYQPLTRKYRVTFGGLHQSYDHLSDALAAVSRAVNWKLIDESQLSKGHHYIDFVYQLDPAQMPRPMQIGIESQPDWLLRVERSQQLN